MIKRVVLLFSIALVVTVGGFGQMASDLTADAQKVVDYLLADWENKFRSTSIPLAMNNLEIKENDDLRFEIAEHFRNNTDLAKNLQWWGANNYILNHDERLIAKYLINHFDAEKTMPKLADLQKEIGISGEAIIKSLSFMARVGFLRQAEGNDLGHKLEEGYKKWGGPLRHNFHTVSIEGQQPFDVW